MTSTTAPGIDLSWVTFEDYRFEEACDYRSDPCSRQATHVGVFRIVSGTCELYSDRILYCVVHRDLLLRQAAASGGLFCCPHGGRCLIAQLLRMEAIR